MNKLNLHRITLAASFIVCLLTLTKVQASHVNHIVSRAGGTISIDGGTTGINGMLITPTAAQVNNADTTFFLFREAHTLGTFKASWNLENVANGKVIIFKPETAGQKVQLEPANSTTAAPYFSLFVIPNGSSSKRIQVIVSDMIIVNQRSNVNGNVDGRNSLFRLGNYHSLTLERDSIDGVNSARMPLIRIGSNTTFNVKNSGIHNVSCSNNSIIENNGGSSTINIENSRLKEWTNNVGDMFKLSDEIILNINNSLIADCTMEGNLIDGSCSNIANSLFDNNTVAQSSGETSMLNFTGTSASGQPSITKTIFSNNRVGGASIGGAKYFFYTNAQGTGNGNVLKINDCVFRENTIASSSTTAEVHLIYIYDVPDGNTFEMTGNAIIGNTLSGGNSDDKFLIATRNIQTVYSYIINNTFSNNSGVTTAVQLMDPWRDGLYFVNNTLYNSGGINAGNNSAEIYIYNNLLFGTSNGITVAGNNVKAARNIFADKFYETGVSYGVPLEGNKPTTYYVDTNLSFDAVTGTSYHAVKPMVEHTAVLRQGGSASAVNNATAEAFLIYDQRKVERPAPPSGLISVGSYDRVEHSLDPRFFIIEYDPDFGMTPGADFDITDALHLYNMFPGGNPALSDIFTWYADSIQPDAGIANLFFDGSAIKVHYEPLTRTVDGLLAPEIGTVGKPLFFTYRVKINGITKIGIVSISIVNVGVPSGIMNEGDAYCQAPMGAVNFSPELKWDWWRANGYHTSSDNAYKNRNTDGYSIPLVADLNGDGRPEVISLGNENKAPGEHIDPTIEASYIYIINGQTGKTLNQFGLPNDFKKTGIWPDGYHSSPSYIAIANVDNSSDRVAEIILAMGYCSNSTYNRRLICYNVDPQSFALTVRWISDTPYDESDNGRGPNGTPDSYFIKSRPVPQIVNIDQAGAPEILVYNKIYDANTGQLKVTLEELDSNANWTATNRHIAQYRDYAYVGRNHRNEYAGDGELNFSAVYDLDGDGNMEVIAGGKVYYDINPANGSYKVKSADATKNRPDGTVAYQPVGTAAGFHGADDIGIGEGFTAVADVDGDGVPDIVVASLLNPSNAGFHGDRGDGILRIQVWDPGLATLDANGTLQSVTDKEYTPPTLKARTDVPFSIIFREGSVSPIYIGDIDGKRQTAGGKKYKLPEISILGGRFYNSFNGISPSNHTATIPMHPNTGLSSNYQFTYTYGGSDQSVANTARGALMSWTWDADPAVTDLSKKLKVSFLMEHQDLSLNTGFSFFDFDNDGTQEIVYRDQYNLQVISVTQPVVKYNDRNNAAVYRFKKPITSYTACEYPTIADVDGDGSADILVQGSRENSQHDNCGSIYVFSAKQGDDRWAPAPSVWNQFHYNPLKIYETMSVPRKNLHPLSAKLAFTKGDDALNGTKTYLYNSNIMQVVSSTVTAQGALETRVPIPDLRIMSLQLDTVSAPGSAFLVVTVRNYGDATANAATPVKFYKGTINYVPSALEDSTTLGEDLYPFNMLKNPQEVTIRHQISWSDRLFNFTVRLADETWKKNGVVTDRWNAPDGFWHDCNWADNVAEIGSFVVRNDAYTVLQLSKNEIDFLKNDSIPAIYRPVTLTPTMFKVKGTAANGDLTGTFGEFSIENNKLYFTAPVTFDDGVVELEYTVSGNSGQITRNGKIFIFIVQSCNCRFVAQEDRPYTFCLMDYPGPMSATPPATPNPYGASFTFYETLTSSIVMKESPVNGWLTVNPMTTTDVWVKPKVHSPDRNNYNLVDFPRAKITLKTTRAGFIYRQPNVY